MSRSAAARKARLPPPLRPGDRIGIAAPAGPVDRQRLERGMDYLRRRGFELVLGEHLFERHGYLAGNDAVRLRDLNRLLADRSVQAVWFARGGYGSGRIVEETDFRPLAARPKVLVGYSDVTVLHAAVFKEQRLVTYYGPNVSDLGDPESFDEGSLWRALGADGSEEFEQPLTGAEVVRPGKGEGILVGGCLSLLASLVGTPLQIPAEGAMLFWEDVNEEPFRIDRMLGQLRQAGSLQGIRGMIIGEPVGCLPEDRENALPLGEIVDRHLGKVRIPVLLGAPAGHARRKLTLPLGRRARLDADERVLRFSGR